MKTQTSTSVKIVLTIETKNVYRSGDVTNAYNEAMDTTTNITDFITSLQANIGGVKIGKGGNHIWIAEAETNERIAIISNLFN